MDIDLQMESYRDCKGHRSLEDKKFYNKKLDNRLIMKSMDRVIENYPVYTSWKWTDDFSYKAQSDKWMKVLFG